MSSSNIFVCSISVFSFTYTSKYVLDVSIWCLSKTSQIYHVQNRNLIFPHIQIILILKFLKFTNLKKSHSHSFSCLNHKPNSNLLYTSLFLNLLQILSVLSACLVNSMFLFLKSTYSSLFTDSLTWAILIYLLTPSHGQLQQFHKQCLHLHLSNIFSTWQQGKGICMSLHCLKSFDYLHHTWGKKSKFFNIYTYKGIYYHIHSNTMQSLFSVLSL